MWRKGRPRTLLTGMYISTATVDNSMEVCQKKLKIELSCCCCCCLVTQLCLTLCDPMDCRPPGSSVHGILQARILEWVAMPSSRGSPQPRSPVLQEDSLLSEPPGKPKNNGVGKPIPSPEELPDPGIKLGSPALQADSLPAELPGKPWFLNTTSVKIHKCSSSCS